MAALSRVRHSGLAVNDEELTPGLRALAAPVRDRSGSVIAAVGIVINLATWNAPIEAIVARLEAPLHLATTDISSHLGYRDGHTSG